MARSTRSARLGFRLALLMIGALAATPSARAGDVSVTLDSGTGFSVKDNTGTVERLRVDEATGNISRNGALFIHSTGGTWNTFVGVGAGNLATTGATNSAFGQYALGSDTSGHSNSAFGFQALRSNTTGNRNTAIGYLALYANTGSYNSAFGFRPLASNTTGANNLAFGNRTMEFNTTGTKNVAFGDFALRRNTTGTRNVGLGYYAGANQTTGSNNIYLANDGVAGESGQIKIGTVGTHTKTTIAGISGATSSSGIAVLVNASGVLGTTTSSARFKQDVRDMGDASDVLMKLRPVTFHYREDVVGEADAKTTQYGLVAEEVEQVAPELVAPDLEGKPYSVKYHELPALLVNEVQKQERVIQEEEQVIAALAARLETDEAESGATCQEVTR